MEDVLKSDVFFFVTTIAVVVWTVLGIIITSLIIKILKDVRFMVRDAKYRYKFIRAIMRKFLHAF